MFVNSLFKDYIMENGMKDWKGESTRDIICLEFNFGTRSYEEEIAHIKKIAKNARIDRKRAKSINSKKQIEIQENKKRKITELYSEANKHHDTYKELSADQIRNYFYENGADV